jgi:HEAT repeat protein
MNVEDRRSLLTELGEASEANFELNYRELGFLGLDDGDGSVREVAINLLWEDETLELMSRLIEVSHTDESARVRAAALSELGRFILLCEYEEIPLSEAVRAQDTAIDILNNENEEIIVRRRALEAISNSSHNIVPVAVLEAYNSGDRLMQISSIFAMGRTCDKRWRDIVMKEIRSSDPEIVYEATRAAGELEITEAIPVLGQLAVDRDRDIQQLAVWSLGEIGGRESLRILNALAEDSEEADDEDLLEAVEDAISNASLSGDFLDFDIDSDDE